MADLGIDMVASLPDSWLAPLLIAIDEHPGIRHVRVTREDEGVALVAGASLARRRALLACQNAGLLLSANALAAYGQHHQLAVPILAVARGGPDDGFYYQAYKGRTTTAVLDAIGVPWFTVTESSAMHQSLDVVNMAWIHRRPAVALLSRAVFLGGAA
jgi:sulfopyruvate decarboxylase subunit alpha